MARPLRICIPGMSFHVFCRGNRKEPIFFSDRDRLVFLSKLDETLTKFCYSCYAFCLMPNHYHLYLKTSRANLSSGIHYLNSSFSNWLKAKHKITGHIFQGRFGSTIVDDAAYALFLSAYIHLNPVRAKICALPEEYRWSSYNDFFDRRKSLFPKLDRVFILRFLHLEPEKALPLYEEYVRDRISLTSLKEHLTQGIALGSEEFVRKLRAEMNIGGNRRENASVLRSDRPSVSIEEISRAIKRAFKEALEKESRTIFGKLDGGITMAMGRGRLNGPELRRASGWKPRTEESELFGEMGDEDGDDFEDAKERSFQSNLMNIRPMSVRVRNITIYLAKKYCDLTLAEIGKFWGLDYSTVSLSAKRMEIQLAHDSALAEIIRRVEEILGVRSQHLNNSNVET